jgi:hypothetical protein
MIVRMATCRELASDHAALAKLQDHYWIIEKSATPTALLFPWFPSPARRAKEASTKVLYIMLRNYIEERRKAAVPNSDTIDLLLGQGMSNDNIIQFVLGIIFAGVANTGINGTSCHPHLISPLFRDLISDNNFFSLLDPPLHLLPRSLEIRYPRRGPRPPGPIYQLL